MDTSYQVQINAKQNDKHANGWVNHGRSFITLADALDHLANNVSIHKGTMDFQIIRTETITTTTKTVVAEVSA